MSVDKVEDIAKRRGFFFPSAEIYGSMSGFYDYGHVGTLMKRKFENLWRKYFLALGENFYEIETPDIMPEGVFTASGHLKNFVDPVVRCAKCGHAVRADHVLEDVLKESFEGMAADELSSLIKQHHVKCEKCKGPLENVGTLTMMFPVSVGTGKEAKAYLRPETAQGAYVAFKRSFEHLRRQLPMGLAIIGKAYRNEISPRNALLRMRSFTQAELQIFFDPVTIHAHPDFASVDSEKLRILAAGHTKAADISCGELAKKLPQFYVYYLAKIQQFYLNLLQLPRDVFRFRELGEEERAFYNKYHYDVQLELDGTWTEVGGLHYRTDHDLSGHARVSKQPMDVSIEGKKFVPHVLEISTGVDRNILALLVLGYREEKERDLFSLPRAVAPFDVAVFPLVNREGMPEAARALWQQLQGVYAAFYDDGGSVGRRYRRMDEIGVPLCITVDGDTLKNNTVTLRERDSMQQVRVRADEVGIKIYRFMLGDDFASLGEPLTKE